MKICNIHEYLISANWKCLNSDPTSGVYAFVKGENSLAVYTKAHGDSDSKVESYRYNFQKDTTVKNKNFDIKVFLKVIKGNYVEFEDFYDEVI